MELHCDSKSTTSNTQDEKTLNVNAEEFRSKRLAAAVAERESEILQTMKISEKHLISIIKWGKNNGNFKVTCNLMNYVYNHGNNILRLFDTLPNFIFITRETKRDY